jgi:hypothetical protein
MQPSCRTPGAGSALSAARWQSNYSGEHGFMAAATISSPRRYYATSSAHSDGRGILGRPTLAKW